MVKESFRRPAILISSILIFLSVITQLSFAQTGNVGPQQQKIRWLSINALRSWFTNFGAEGEYFRRDRTTYVSQDQIDGLCWPNEYNSRMKGVNVGKALWIGTTNFKDPVTNITYPYKVVCSGPEAVYSGTEIIADESFGEGGITLLGRYNHPGVFVDNVNASARLDDDNIDIIDNSISADRIIVNKFNTSIGISVTRKVLAFAQQYNDNYYIYEYTLKNTGIIDETGKKKLNDTLKGVIFYLQSKYSFVGESYTGQVTGGWYPSSSSWGRNTINDVIGQDAAHPGEFRAEWSYWGPMTTSVVQMGIPEDIGCPGPSRLNVYTLAGSQFAGTVVLHADKSPQDKSDDPLQPTTTHFVGSDNAINWNGQFNQNLMTQKYNQFMTAGHDAATQAEQIGKDANGWPTSLANAFGTDAGGYASAQGFGPYTLAPGDSIRIVVAEAVAGINHDKIREVALNWFNNNTAGFILPKGYKNGGITADRNEYKNAWVFSGKDSLFQTFRRAIANYNSNYNIPQPPAPPENFMVSTIGNNISLNWSGNSESSPHFNGYRIYRAEGRADTTFDLIFECNKANAVNSFDDTTAKPGIGYFYYIQSKDDGSTNNIQPGVPLVSSKYYTMLGKAVSFVNHTSSFRSHQSGNWNSNSTWEKLDGTKWVSPSPDIPSGLEIPVYILNGHTITVTSKDTANQLCIAAEGTLIIAQNAELTIKNGTGLSVYGSIKNSGLINPENDSTTIEFKDTSKYFHECNGGAIPAAVWGIGTTCRIDSVKDTMPLNSMQAFCNFIWDCPKQTGNVNLNWATNNYPGIEITGNVLIKNTGSGTLQMCSPGVNNETYIRIDGNFIQTGGNFIVYNAEDPKAGIGVAIYGSTEIKGGTFSLNSGGKSGETSWSIIGDHFSLSNASFENSNPGGANLYLGGYKQKLLLGPNYTKNNFSVITGSNTTLDLNNNALDGNGNFTMDPGAVLVVTHPGGIDSTIKVTGIKTMENGSGFIFCGNSAQVSGNLLPDVIGSLTVNNPAGVTIPKNIAINGTLELKNGNLNPGNKKLSYGPDGTLKYSETAFTKTSDVEFPAVNGPANLIINNKAGILLHNSRKINGSVSLLSGKLFLNSDTLEVSNKDQKYHDARSDEDQSLNYIVTNENSALKMPVINYFHSNYFVTFPIGTPKGYAPVIVNNAGKSDTITVSAIDDTARVPGQGRINVKWKLNENTPGDGKYIITFCWTNVFINPFFQNNQTNNAKLYRLSDTSRVSSGSYNLSSSLSKVQTKTISKLDSFAVGGFKVLSDVKENIEILPTAFKLNQNFPNPFNPLTKIKYNLPVTSSVKIDVYSILGIKVKTLVNKIMNAGYHEVNFDAGILASGIYLYSIEANAVDGSKNFREVKKMILLK